MDHARKKPKVVGGVDVANDKEDCNDVEEEDEEALVALFEHRNKEVKHLAQRVSYFTKQLEDTKKRLNESQSKLSCLRRKHGIGESKATADGDTTKSVDGLTSVTHTDEIQSQIQNGFKPPVLILALNAKSRHPKRLEGNMDSSAIQKGEAFRRVSFDLESDKLHDSGRVHKSGKEECRGLIPVIGSCSTPCTIRIQPSTQISSQHKRNLRSLVLNPISDELFVTSALDGIIKLWQIQSNGSNVSLLSSTNCLSPMTRWPEDITCHPYGDSIFAVYSADDGDYQVSILNLNSSKETSVTFLEEKPHHRGAINGVMFMPWSSICFVTGGSDHAVVLWNEKYGGNIWKPKLLHRHIHSSAVMGVAGMPHKHLVVSSGADKRIIGFDAEGGKADFKHQIDSKCTRVLPNPSDFNLFMVQTGTPEKQLRLFDVRVRQTEIHAFGWKQETSDSQSALIGQAWSPDGLYITSGSADPVIYIFDIRYNSHGPSQSVKAHQKRVFKAVWHRSFPVLISISADFHIGLHKINQP